MGRAKRKRKNAMARKKAKRADKSWGLLAWEIINGYVAVWPLPRRGTI